jgi:hypothetical protein
MQRSHGMSRSQLQGKVDIADRRVLAIYHEHSLGQTGNQETVNNEALWCT